MSHTLKRVSLEEQEVGSLSDAERAELIVLAQKDGWHNGGCANRFVWCETALRQQFELALDRGARGDERQPHRIGANDKRHARPMQGAGDLSQVPNVRQRLVLLQHDIESQIHRRMADQRNAHLARGRVHCAVSHQ